MDMHIATQTYTLPVIIYGSRAGDVASLYGFENLAGDSSLRTTTWNAKYSIKHSRPVCAVGVIETKSNIFVVSVSSAELIVRHLLEPDAIICKNQSKSQITAMRTTPDTIDTRIFVALSNGSIEVLSLELNANTKTYSVVVKHVIAASRLKSVTRVSRIVGLEIVSDVVPFDTLCLIDKSQKVAALSPTSLVVFSGSDAKVYYEKSLVNDPGNGILSVARQTHTDHVWLMRDGTINTLYGKRQTVMSTSVARDVCDIALLQSQVMLVVGRDNAVYISDGKQILYSDIIRGCIQTFCIKEINDTIYVLQCGIPEMLRINTDIVRGPRALLYPVLRDGKTFETPTAPLLPQLLPPRSHVDDVMNRLAGWCSAPCSLEIPSRQARQTINECHYLALAVPDYVPSAICRILETHMDSASDQAIYVMLKCVQAVMRTENTKTKMKFARVLTECYLTNWNHRHFVLHLLSRDEEIARMADGWIADACFEMQGGTELGDLIDAAKCVLI